MGVTFKGGNGKQLFLFPLNLEDHLARFIVEVVDQLDISLIKNEYGSSLVAELMIRQ